MTSDKHSSSGSSSSAVATQVQEDDDLKRVHALEKGNEKVGEDKDEEVIVESDSEKESSENPSNHQEEKTEELSKEQLKSQRRRRSSWRRSSTRGLGLRLSLEYLAILRPDLGGESAASRLSHASCWQWCFFLCPPTSDVGNAIEDVDIATIRTILSTGRPMPALVAQIQPLVVAVYSEIFDVVVFLRYPWQISRALVSNFKLKLRGKLLAVSSLRRRILEDDKMDPDVFLGPSAKPRVAEYYLGFRTEIANFISLDADRIADQIEDIPEDLWNLALLRMEQHQPDTKLYRNGIPGHTWLYERGD